MLAPYHHPWAHPGGLELGLMRAKCPTVCVRGLLATLQKEVKFVEWTGMVEKCKK